ncbi:hypothetical protein ACTFFF_05270, partial [Campylobacter jejuni]
AREVHALHVHAAGSQHTEQRLEQLSELLEITREAVLEQVSVVVQRKGLGLSVSANMLIIVGWL